MDKMELNMRIEAKLYVNEGIELPSNAHLPIREQKRAVIVKEEIAKYEVEHGTTWQFKPKRTQPLPWTTAQRAGIKQSLQNGLEKMKEELNLADNDIEYWLDYAESLYEIDSDFTVNSFAKQRGPNKSWAAKDESEARDIIAQHIIWLASNRRRGQGDVTNDLHGVRQL